MSNLHVSFSFNEGMGYVILRNWAAPRSGADVIAMIEAIETERSYGEQIVPLWWQELPEGDGTNV